MVEPVGTAWLVLPVQSFLPSRRTRERHETKSNRSLSSHGKTEVFCYCGQISLNSCEDITVGTVY